LERLIRTSAIQTLVRTIGEQEERRSKEFWLASRPSDFFDKSLGVLCVSAVFYISGRGITAEARRAQRVV
jgi:hypothetical protein